MEFGDGVVPTWLKFEPSRDDAIAELHWILSIDFTVTRAHQHAAGAWKKGAAHPESKPSPSTEKDSVDPAED